MRNCRGKSPHAERMGMRGPTRDDLTFSNLVSAAALFVALGGTSYAVATGSIGSREIRDNSVRGRDIRNRTIGHRDVKRNGLGGATFKKLAPARAPRRRNPPGLVGLTLPELPVPVPA